MPAPAPSAPALGSSRMATGRRASWQSAPAAARGCRDDRGRHRSAAVHSRRRSRRRPPPTGPRSPTRAPASTCTRSGWRWRRPTAYRARRGSPRDHGPPAASPSRARGGRCPGARRRPAPPAARKRRPGPSNPTEKVVSRPEIARRARADTVDESTPPERKTPTGTSATSWRSTAPARMARSRSAASSRDDPPRLGFGRPPVGPQLLATISGEAEHRSRGHRPHPFEQRPTG